MKCSSWNYIKNIRLEFHNLPPINIRDLLEFKKQRKPIDLNEVEPIEEILKDLEAEVCLLVALSAEALKL